LGHFECIQGPLYGQLSLPTSWKWLSVQGIASGPAWCRMKIEMINCLTFLCIFAVLLFAVNGHKCDTTGNACAESGCDGPSGVCLMCKYTKGAEPSQCVSKNTCTHKLKSVVKEGNDEICCVLADTETTAWDKASGGRIAKIPDLCTSLYCVKSEATDKPKCKITKTGTTFTVAAEETCAAEANKICCLDVDSTLGNGLEAAGLTKFPDACSGADTTTKKNSQPKTLGHVSDKFPFMLLTVLYSMV